MVDLYGIQFREVFVNIGEMNIVITGAAGGVGSHLFDFFHKNAKGVFGVLHHPNEQMMAQYGNLFHAVDLLDKSAVARAFQAISARMGTIHVLINTVGGYRSGKLIEETSEEWMAMYSLNVQTVLNACQVMIPIMRKQGTGHILNFGAQSAMEGINRAAPYCGAKMMVHTLSKCIAKEGQGSVRCNVIAPWTMDTPKNRQNFPEATFSSWTSLDKITQKVVDTLESEDNGKLKFI